MTSDLKNVPGYLNPQFGCSYSEFGAPLRLTGSGIQLIRQQINGDDYDCAGVYPYVMSPRWSALEEDVPELQSKGAVATVFVADPFCEQDVRLACGNWDVCRPFKTHYVVDLTQDWRRNRPKEMRRIARRALENHDMQVVRDPAPLAPQLWQMYQNTIHRHRVSGMQALSLQTIERQLNIAGGILIAASDSAGLVGAILTFNHGQTANLHLLFLSERARDLNTTYALIYATLEALEASNCHFANLGGAAGHSDAATDGLARFKSGWSNETRTSLLCGKILDPERYRKLDAQVSARAPDFFPSYRSARTGAST